MIKAVIFDMDGVLIDAREWHFLALNRALGLFGYTIPLEEHLKTYDGLPTSKKLEILQIQHGLPTAIHSLVNKLKQSYTVDMVTLNCRPTFNHEYALSRLKSEGIKIAVASNSIHETVRLMMEKANLTSYLEFFLSNEDVKTPKPSPEIYTLAIEKLGINANEALVGEDNEHGIQAARDAGAHVLVVDSPKEVTYWKIKTAIQEFERSDK